MVSKSTMNAQRLGGIKPMTIAVILVIFLIGGVGAYAFVSTDRNVASFDPILTSVTSGEFVSKVLDQGEIESSENVEVRCEVKARNGQITVLRTTQEGSRVSEGEFLVQLDATGFEKELEAQNLAVANAQTALIQAETQLETAKASEQEYIQGVFVEALQTIENEIYDAESQIQTAKQELEQSIAVREHSEKLHSKGFITNRQLTADQFAVKKSEIAIKKAENLLKLSQSKRKVLMEVTQKKELTRLRADIRSAEVNLTSQQKSLEVENLKTDEILELIKKCTITVPKGVTGQVVFAKERSGRGQEWVLEEGATVRQNQVLIRLPNQEKMQVKALINEQNITQIEPGMPVLIQVDALEDTSLKGIVTKVNQYAESKGWFSSNVRKYAVFIQILDPPSTLKPGMNASVSIQARFEKDVLQAPLQTVYSVQSESFCLVKMGDKFETRTVDIDGNNSQFVLIRSGLKEGDQLVMNPGLYKDRMDLPEVSADPKIEIPPGGVEQVLANQKVDSRVTNVEPPKKPGRPQSGRPTGGGGMAEGLLAKYDNNQDDVIDESEIALMEERSKSFVTRADKDTDGKVTKAELIKFSSDMPTRGGGGGGGRQSAAAPAAHDDGGGTP